MRVVRLLLIAVFLILTISPALAQKLDVKIIDRQDKEDSYEYAAVYNNVAVGKTFQVHGATFTLSLPDGRLAIVNCESKFAEHMAGPAEIERVVARQLWTISRLTSKVAMQS